MFFSSIRTLLAGVALCAMPLAASAAPLSSFVPFDGQTSVRGAADAGTIVHVDVALRMRDFAGLESAVFGHHVLTPAQMQAHLPTQADHDRVAAWLRGQGLAIERTSPTRLAIRVSGPAALVGRVFDVNFVNVTRAGATYVSADREPVMPAAIADRVVGLNGLQPQYHAEPMLVFNQGLSATNSGGIQPPLLPSQLQKAYKSLGNGTGAGATTAIVIDTFPFTSDLTQFWQTAGVNQSLSNITFIQTVPGTLDPQSGEESLDVEQSSSIAPDSKVRVYASANLQFTSIDQSFLAIISDLMTGVPVTQVSISLGACETSVAAAQKTTDDQYFAMISGLGASIFVSSGDKGARECAPFNGIARGPIVPSFYSTSPNVTAVGGTSLVLSPTGATQAEGAWRFSGGGISQFYPTPSWQQGLGYPMRAVPDVASDGNPQTGVLLIYNQGQSIQVGGTSVSSPDWAGFMALTNAKRLSKHKPPLGLVAARTVGLTGTANFRDITAGSNYGYSAGVGFDLVTGNGSPLMNNLQATLVAQP